MAQAKILFADNDRDFLETRGEFLKREGYDVISAFSPIEAREKVEQENPDLAIVDIRLVNDDDDKDNSGLELATEINRSVPVLLHTGYPSLEYARKVLKPQLDGLPTAYDFIVKHDGPEPLLTALRNALESAENRKRIISLSTLEVKRVTWWQQWRPIVGLIALLLALGAGVSAMVFRDPGWLFGTVAFAIVAVVVIGLTGEQSE